MKKLILILMFFGVISCSKNDMETQEINILSNARIEGNIPDEGEMILGEKVTNPYEIKNMQKALESLKKRKIEASSLEIEPNYKYVRFLPKDKNEYDKINNDPNIDVFEYPLDYKIVKNGNKYKDKSLGKSEFSWLYSAVPISMEFDKKIKSEVIDLLYLPEGNGRDDEYVKTMKNKGSSHENLLKELENESFSIFGDGKYGKPQSTKSGRVAEWYASGRIRVQDERMSYNESTNQYIKTTGGWVPVPGCQVRGNRWFTTKTTLSLEDGTFFINHGWPNGSPVDMDIKWDRDDFDIRTGSYGQAITSNQNISGSWYPNITKTISPDHFIYAHVHRAAWYYYYKNTFGVKSPPPANFPGLGGKIHLGAKQGTGRSHYFAFNNAWLASDVKLIFNLTSDQGRSIFGTTIHELTHAAHWAIGMSYAAYCSNAGQAGRLAESWAQAVGWHVTRSIYGISTWPFDDFDHSQNITLSNMGATSTCASNGGWYTPLFIDLIDNFNQNGYSNNYPLDNAKDYRISQLDSFLVARPNNWYMYRDYLQNNSNNTTETAAVQLFSDYD
jgi:hypothetical protein